MPTRRQVGGLQEVYLQLSAKNIASVERAIKAIEKQGGKVRHAYPPSILVASVPTDEIKGLVGKSGILSADTGIISSQSRSTATHTGALGVAAWNEHIGSERRLRTMASPELGKTWDAPNRLPPHPPREIMEKLRRREAEIAPHLTRAPLIAGAPNLNIPVMVGRIGVGVVFVDSTIAQYQITNAEKSKIVTELTEGLNLFPSFEPRANIQWFYDFKRPKISLAGNQFTNANKDNWEDLWRNAAMQTLGFNASVTGMNNYINQVKTNNNAQWAYALFVTKYPITWFAYEWGNHVVMDFAVDGWGIDNFSRVVAHETGHIFGCPDEYSSANCNCTSLFGRYQVANGNCQSCANPFVPCLMASNTEAVCDYTRGHLGWNELAVQSEGTATLKGTWTFDFDTGVQGPASGADIWWEQVNTVTRFLVPQSGAMLAHMGKPNFDAVSLQTLKAQPYTATPINGSNNSSNKLTAGTVIAVKTGAGRYAKMKVNTYGYNLVITWVTYK